MIVESVWNTRKLQKGPPVVILVKGVLKYPSNVQEDTHAEVWFQ